MPGTDPVDGEQHSVTDFGRLLHRHRQARDLTQEQLAERAGLSVRTISDMERGRARGPQQRSVDAIAEVLGLAGDAAAEFQAAARAGRTRGRSDVDTRAAAPGAGLCEVPPELGELIGRTAELAWLRQFASGAVTSDGRVRTVATVIGPPGVGKTTLAVRAAYELRPLFPDGVYFLDLRGMDEQPVSGLAALDRLLRSLGVGEGSLPPTLDERASVYRSLVRDRRMLLVLDNVRDESQVRPLLPGSAGGLLVTTSRRALTGLDGVHRLALDVLARDDAVHLLDAAAGSGRIQAERAAATELAELCGDLPLALRLVGNRLAARQGWTIRHLVEQLAGQHRRLSLLTAGDRQVRAAFDVSYQQLSPAEQLVFRRAALVPGPDFGSRIAGVAAGIDEIAAMAALDELLDASVLLPAPREGRYRFHDLLRLYARERLAAEETPDAVRAAERDVADWLLSNVVVAGRLLNPEFAADPPRGTELPDSAAAVRWLDDEDGNWLPALTRAAADGQHERVVAATRALQWYSDVRTDRCPWHEIFSLGAASARAAGSRRDEAALLNSLCWALWVCLPRFQEALGVQAEALAVAREIGDRREEGWALVSGAAVHRQLGNMAEAAAAGQGAVEAFREVGYLPGEMMATGVLGNALRSLGRLDEALAAHQGMLANLNHDSDEPFDLATRAQAHLLIAEDYVAMSRWSEALGAFREVRELCARNGPRVIEGVALRGQAHALVGLGDAQPARAVLAEAVEIFQECGDLWELADTERLVGDTAWDLGEPAEAVTWWQRALRTCAKLPGNPTADELAGQLRQKLADRAGGQVSPPLAGGVSPAAS